MKNIITILILFLSITSCTASNSTDASADINDSLTILAPPQVNSFQVNGFIGLMVQNNTKDNIKMSAEYGIHILEKKGDEWIDVTAINPYISPTTIAPQSDSELDFAYLNFLFNYETQEPKVFRFMVLGVNQRTNKEVSAFIDLTLFPEAVPGSVINSKRDCRNDSPVCATPLSLRRVLR